MHFAEKETLPGVRQSKGLNTKCHHPKENIIPNLLTALLLISFFFQLDPSIYAAILFSVKEERSCDDIILKNILACTMNQMIGQAFGIKCLSFL